MRVCQKCENYIKQQNYMNLWLYNYDTPTSVCVKSYNFSNSVGSGANSKSEVFQGCFKLHCLLGSEPTLAVNPIKFVVEPRRGFLEIVVGNFPPRDYEQNVIKPISHCFFHNSKCFGNISKREQHRLKCGSRNCHSSIFGGSTRSSNSLWAENFRLR